MADIIFKVLGYVGIIALAYILKRAGAIKRSDADVISKMLLWVTLPCSVITAFSFGSDIAKLIYMPILGFALNWLMIGVAFLFSRKKDKKDRVLYSLTFSGFNIGAFALPFVQGFLGSPEIVATVCTFDVGNAIMSTGGVYALSKGIIGGKNSPKEFLKNLFSSVPFDTYLLMFVLTIFGITLPTPVLNLVSVAANANGFVAMFLIGVLLEFSSKPSFLKKTATILIVRYIGSILFALAAYFLLPLPVELKQGIVIIMFSPITALASVFANKCDARSDIAGFAASCSFVISIICITVLVILFGLK